MLEVYRLMKELLETTGADTVTFEYTKNVLVIRAYFGEMAFSHSFHKLDIELGKIDIADFFMKKALEFTSVTDAM